MFKQWTEYHNWGILCLAIILVVIGGMINSHYIHLEDMEHIKQGHCKSVVLGSQTHEWQICK